MSRVDQEKVLKYIKQLCNKRVQLIFSLGGGVGRIMAGLLLIISNVNNQHMQAVNNILAKTTVSQAPGFFFFG